MSFFVESIFSGALKLFFTVPKVSLFSSDHFFPALSLFLNTANNNNRVAASDDVVSLERAFTN